MQSENQHVAFGLNDLVPIGQNLLILKSKAEDVRNRLSDLQANFERNPNIQWPDLLEQFMVLSGQLLKLNEEMQKLTTSPTEDQLVVFPTLINSLNPSEVPETLRTKGLPEVELEEQKMLQIYNSHENSQSENSRNQLTILSGRINEYNSICEHIERVFDEQKEGILTSNSSVQVSPFSSQMGKNTNIALKTFASALSTGTGLSYSANTQNMNAKPIHPNVVIRNQPFQ